MRYFMICAAAFLAFAGTLSCASASTITDNFDASHDYLTGGVSGTVWDGLLNGGNATTLDANTTNAGELTIALSNAAGYGWDATHANAPFLYKEISGAKDMTVQVKIASALTANYSVPGLLVYKDDSNFISVNANHIDPSKEVCGRFVVGGVEYTTSSSHATFYADDPIYLKMSYTAADQIMKYWSSSDGTNWTAGKWYGGSTDLVLTGLTGPVKVGIQYSDYVSGSGNVARFDNFSLTEVPEPSAIILTAFGMFGLLAYAWRKQR